MGPAPERVNKSPMNFVKETCFPPFLSEAPVKADKEHLRDGLAFLKTGLGPVFQDYHLRLGRGSGDLGRSVPQKLGEKIMSLLNGQGMENWFRRAAGRTQKTCSFQSSLFAAFF